MDENSVESRSLESSIELDLQAEREPRFWRGFNRRRCHLVEEAEGYQLKRRCGSNRNRKGRNHPPAKVIRSEVYEIEELGRFNETKALNFLNVNRMWMDGAFE